ncbi:MAG: hypothetical protein JWL62_2805 [Hyphomicrobiales bacterium]|nr:hypothetical protein [Hyphomicrobiales bacterium]
MQTSDTTFSPSSGIGWSAVIAASTITAALFFVFVTFGSALGLGVASSAPTWRDTSFALWLLSGVYLLVAALTSFAVGGYIAGRLHARGFATDEDQPEFHAGLRGLVVWALAVILGALMTLALTRALTPPAVPSGGNAGTSASVGGESLIAYELDRLFRAERRPGEDLTYPRSEAARILLTTSGHEDIAAEDRRYLSTLVRGATGIAPPDADRRVNDVVVRARDALTKARRVTVLLGFMTAASLLAGAAVAWFASVRGERDGRGLDVSAFHAMFGNTGAPGLPPRATFGTPGPDQTRTPI